MFHNTTNEDGSQLARSESQAATQQQLVYEFYVRNADVPYAAHEAHNAVFDLRTPLTSTRRAISNLARDGLLQKTGICTLGPYGKSVYCWVSPSAATVSDINWDGV